MLGAVCCCAGSTRLPDIAWGLQGMPIMLVMQHCYTVYDTPTVHGRQACASCSAGQQEGLRASCLPQSPPLWCCIGLCLQALGVPTQSAWPGFADLPHKIDFKPAPGKPLQQVFKQVSVCVCVHVMSGDIPRGCRHEVCASKKRQVDVSGVCA